MNVILNNIEHKTLYVLDASTPGYESNTHFAQLMPVELRIAQNIFPIFFQKDSNTGKFFISALLGFIDGENLFLDKSGWTTSYIPMTIARQPFMITAQNSIENGVKKTSFVISLDLDNPKVNKSEGKRVFNDNGEATEFLKQISSILDEIHHGLVESDQFIERLLAHNLIESAMLEVTLDPYRRYELANLYTINEDALSALPNDIICTLFKNGDLEKIYAILFSQGHVSTLIKLKRHQENS